MKWASGMKKSMRDALLRWTKMVPVVEGKDPLGLSGRVSNRLANQLLYCITSITPRARYFSFLPWCVAEYRRHQMGTRSDDGLDRAIRLRERAFTLGCVARHDGQPCTGGSLVGSKKAQIWYEKRGRTKLKLTKLSFAKNPALKAYYRSLVNLGVFLEQEGVELDESGEVTSAFTFDDLELTPLGQALAECYGKAVNQLSCMRKLPTHPDDCSINELSAWGTRGGLCELTTDGPDLRILRDIFFCRKRTSDSAHGLRHDTLVLLLELIRQFARSTTELNTVTFNDAMYFGETTSDYTGTDTVVVELPHALQGIANRWRMFHFHYFLAVALETLFVFVVRQTREAGLRGVSHTELLSNLNSAATHKAVVQRLGTSLPRQFFQLTPRDTAAICGISLATADVPASQRFDQSVRLLHPLSEARLDYLIREEAGFDSSEGAALALLMLGASLMRFVRWENTDYGRWLANSVEQPYEDVTTPVMLVELRNRFGDFWNTPWNLLGTFIVNRFVIRLHEVLSFEKSSAQAKAFFHVDQHRLYWRNLRYGQISVTNSRLGSALQILTDLGYTQREPDQRDVYRLTPEGKKCLNVELRRMGGP
jgi:hypothetical protein